MLVSHLDCEHPIFIKVELKDDDKMYGYVVPCGRCVKCTKKRRLEWTLRLIMEAQYYDPNSIAWVTLTYRTEELKTFPTSRTPYLLTKPTLWPLDFTKFMKRLRRRLDYKIRFYAVGEYGSKFQRPHMHLIIFGLKPEDWHYIKEVWSKGFVCVKNFYKETCGYAAGYIQKKLFGGDVYDGRIAPFMRCSLNPSIGQRYFEDNIDTICQQGFIKFNNVKCSIPRTFQRKAYELGKLYKADMDELQLIQNADLCEFLDHLDMQDVEFSDYYKNFCILADNEFRRMNVTRNNFDTDFGCEVI